MKLIILTVIMSVFLGCTRKNFSPMGRGGSTAHAPSEVGQGPDVGNAGMEEKLLDSALIWKRYRAFEQGLMAGLELSKNQLCQEAGEYSCVDNVHLTFLGGNEPYDNAQHERPERPSVLTSVAVDRILLSACTARARLDRAAGTGGAAVFNHFPLDAQGLSPAQLEPQVVDLYRRLLARDPSADELRIASSFASEITAADRLAVALCFAIGTSAENIFL